MDAKTGKCTVCPQKCSWKDHVNTSFFYEGYEELVMQESKELKDKYTVATSEKTKREQILDGL